ncbi:MAG: DUF2520 domain-containing protein [Saprospiraceae bacterium]|nr:DUF2520 domain-containing protein [Saprospiraceae bacterium]
MIKTISIIGSGNVAWHLAESFTLAGMEILEVCGRNGNDAPAFEAFGEIKFITDISDFSPHADLYFVCLSDDAIESVLDTLPFSLNKYQMLVHTSGARPSTILAPYALHYGSFWPLQTLTKEAQIVSNEIPIMFNASDEETASVLVILADMISDSFLEVTDDKKQTMHLAAVMLNNFTNFLYTLTAEYCTSNDIDFSNFFPLIKETALKISQYPTEEIQTGPARRNDITTIEKHLNQLEDHPELYKIYCVFTESIIKKYHKK